MQNYSTLPDEIIINKIFLIRGQKVMIDRHLAELYGVETKRLKEAVRRNSSRFPEDFMFEMNDTEFIKWRNENVFFQDDKMGLRYPPFCFTEQGVTMLSCVLNSERAIDVNIKIIRIFIKLREMILTNKEILLKLEKLEKQVLQNDEDIKMIFNAIKQLLNPPVKDRKKIGFINNE